MCGTEDPSEDTRGLVVRLRGVFRIKLEALFRITY
jgi:hypothetical protein